MENRNLFPTNANWNKQVFFEGPNKFKRQKWKIVLQNTLSISKPVIDQKCNIIFGTNNGQVFSYNKSGDINWICEIGKGILSSPVIEDQGNIYILLCEEEGDNYLCKLDSYGDLLWKQSINHDFHFEPIIDKWGDVYVTTWTSLIKMDSFGNVIWSFRCDNISSYPIIDLWGNIYFSCREGLGDIISLARDGSVRWRKGLGKCFLEYEPVIDQEGNLYFITNENNLHSLYSINCDGNINWKFTPSGRGIISSLALGEDKIIVMGTTYFKMIAIDTSGKLLWETDTGHITQFTPILDIKNNIYFYTQVKARKTHSYIWCLDKNGLTLWNYKVKYALQWLYFNPEIGLLTMTVDSDIYLLELIVYEY